MFNSKEAYKEDYYTGPRTMSTWWRKINGIIPSRRNNNTDSFKVLYILNHQPRSAGIVSYSLFGDSKVERFRKHLLEPLLSNSKKLKENLPLWSSRIYISLNIHENIKNELVNAGYELFVMPPPYSGEGYAWRFLAGSENKPVVFHDADMLFTSNTFKVINNWLNTNKPFLRRKLTTDNYFFVPISAGCWGIKPLNNKSSPLSDIKSLLDNYIFESFGSDEAFLTKEVWPIMKKEGYYSTEESWILILIVILSAIALIVLSLYLWRRFK